MDIKGPNINGLRPESQNGGVRGRDDDPRTGNGAARPGSGEAASGDSVTLTGAAQAMNSGGEASEAAPFNEAKVAEIREAIAQGNYPIDNEELADRMMELEGLLR